MGPPIEVPKPPSVVPPPPKEEERIIIQDVIFDFDSSKIKKEMVPILEKAVEILKGRTDHLVLEGHTCSIGSDEYNQRLSEHRAASVKAFFIEKGIPAFSIKTAAYGETRPKFDNSTKEGRRLNRRVEIHLQGLDTHQTLGTEKDLQPENEMAGIKEQFEQFALMWLDKVRNSYHGTPEKVSISTENGRSVARYYTLDPKSLTLQVEKSSSTTSPYVGVMKYNEYLHESQGDNQETAKAGPFSVVKKIRITEIFLYSNGRWGK
jgi:hypothetical protein